MFINKTYAALSLLTCLAAAAAQWATGDHNIVQLAIQAAICLILTFGVLWLVESYRKSLLKRMEVSNTKAWAIHVNGVRVDVITDRAYAALQRQLYGNSSLLLAQALNMLRTAALLAGFVAMIVPLLCFWVGAASLSNSPWEPAVMLSMALRANVADVHSMLFLLTVAASLLAFTLFAAMPSMFGLRNLYREEAHDKLRRFAKSAASGDVTLLPTIAATSSNPADKGSMSMAA